MRIYSRQKLLLALLKAAGGSLPATDFQKLLFLYTRKWEAEPSYDFVPHRFGCFSFESAADRSTLIAKGLLYPREGGEWRLTSKAAPHVPGELAGCLRAFVSEVVPERGNALIRRVYREAPYYATRSEILNRIIPDKQERARILEAAPKAVGRALFTIGYEGDCIDGYLDRLIRNGVVLLCDVRRNPLSRKTGFSKKQLEGYCGRVGIAYRHLPALGIAGHRRRQLETRADYDALFAEYREEDLAGAGDAIDELFHLLETHGRIALTCFEKDPECCHRHCVAEAMEKAFAQCPSPRHI